MSFLHETLRRIFALLLGPLDAAPPLLALSVISALSGVLLLVGFRWTSNPRAIRAARRRVQAHLLAVRIYRDDLRVVLRSQLAVFAALGGYVARMTVPFLALLVPFAILFAHLDARFGARSLRPGERAVVKATSVRDATAVWTLEASTGVVVETPPVRIGSRAETSWRIRAAEPGDAEITVVADGRRVTKRVRVAIADRGAAPRREAASIEALFLAPAEPPIDGTSGLASLEVVYPSLPLVVFGWDLHWIVVFVVVSSAVALILRKRAGVEF